MKVVVVKMTTECVKQQFPWDSEYLSGYCTLVRLHEDCRALCSLPATIRRLLPRIGIYFKVLCSSDRDWCFASRRYYYYWSRLPSPPPPSLSFLLYLSIVGEQLSDSLHGVFLGRRPKKREGSLVIPPRRPGTENVLTSQPIKFRSYFIF